MELKVLGARGAQKTRDDSKKLQMYSKQWLPGDTMRLFFPVFQLNGRWEIAVGALWGHNVNDFEGIGLKTTFIPSLTEFDENGEPVGPPDITYKFSGIAKVFIDGQKQLEEARLQAKKWPTEAARKEALQKLEHQYDAKNNMNAIKPAISRPVYNITTEVLCLKIVNDKPDIGSLKLASFPLSNEKINKLYSILDDQKYSPSEGDQFFEVEWKYPSNPDKGQSAKSASPAGLTAEYRLAATDPDAYKTVEGMLPMLSRDASSIVRRATKKVSEAKIRSALTSYSFVHSENIDACIEDDEETLIKNADLIHELGLIKAMENQALIEKINAELATRTTDPAPEVPNLGAGIPQAEDLGSTAAPDLGVTDAPDLGSTAAPDLGSTAAPDLGAPETEAASPAVDFTANLNGVTGSPSIQDLMNNPLNNGADDNRLEEVNLDMM